MSRRCSRCRQPLPDTRRDDWCLECRRAYQADYDRRVASGEHSPRSRRQTEEQMARLDAARHALIEADTRAGLATIPRPIDGCCPRCGTHLHRADGDLDCYVCGYRW